MDDDDDDDNDGEEVEEEDINDDDDDKQGGVKRDRAVSCSYAASLPADPQLDIIRCLTDCHY